MNIHQRTLSKKCIMTNIALLVHNTQVGTAMNHPHKGKTQLFRRNVSSAELREIFRVRSHHHN